ncbi:MAG: glycosyltransferase family 39 protein, partial [Clostridia bacterium]|nr:glycosyltransferase family 39 protein [Clostridia bacterium]
MINTNLLSAMSALGIGFALIVSVLAVVAFALLVWFTTKNLGENNGASMFKYAVIIAVGAMVIRFVFSLFIGGFRDDFLTYKNVLESMSSGGLSDYFSKFSTQISLVSYYLVLMFGGIGRAFGFSTIGAEISVFIKIPFIIADAITVMLLYRIASKYINEKVGLIVSGAFAVCPVFVICSGLYGSTVSLVIPLLIWSAYSLVNKRHFQSIFAFGLAMLTHPVAIYIFPVYAVYYIYRFVRSIITTVKAKKAGKNDKKSKLFIKILAYYLISMVAIYVICLPISAKSIGYNPFVLIYSLFLKPLAEAYYFSNNGLSLYNIFGRNSITL